ncbi:MAG: Type secretion system protein [Firmicutes bacterium]|nr:Type secretion system protein [Bacillota bacterium]
MTFFTSNKPTLSDLYHFFKVIQRYNAANIPISESVPIFAEETKKVSLKKIMEILTRDLKNGLSFPNALSKHPTFFPAFIIEMMRVGETTGENAGILDEIVFFLEQEIDIKRDVKSALWAPKAFLVGMFIAFLLGIFLVIPKMGELLSDANIELPLVTQLVIGVGSLAQTFWWFFAFLGVVAIVLYRYAQKEYPEKMDLFKLRIPFFNVITYNQIQYRFAKIFALCVQSGIGTTRALQYTAMASDNIVVKNTLKRAANYVEKSGMSLADAIKKADVHNVINSSFYIMLRVGLSTSDIAPIMFKESENYRKDMLVASKLLGDKVGLAVTIPGYVALIILFASIEFPVMTMMQNLNSIGGV